MSSFERLQSCPNCFRRHDISIYVSGQKIACICGIRFEVMRTEMKASVDKPALPSLPVASQSQVDTRVAPLKPPSILGYVLLERIGHGGMGEVWRAEQVSLKRTVAVKLLATSFENAAEFVGRFEKEASALALLSHPNIIQVIDKGVADNRYYIVMEYVPGQSLRTKLSNGRLALQESIQLISVIARAVDYMHTQAVIHRDLKPENILLDEKGNVKVADFGLAGIQGGTKEFALTATAVAMGSVNYMPPEQRKDAKHVDLRADIYALGVIFYEMLTGELPIGRFKMPSEIDSHFPPSLDKMVSRMLQADPEARPDSALRIAEELEALLQSKRAQKNKKKPYGLFWWLFAALIGGFLAYMGFCLAKKNEGTEQLSTPPIQASQRMR